jgi:hypothetical protein
MFAQLRNISKVIVAVALIGGASSAQAESYDIRLRAFVPTSCSADFKENFSQVSAASFALGRIDQSCNTRFQLVLSHGAVGPSAYATLGGQLVHLGSTQTELKALAKPVANASEELAIHGFNSTQAEKFRSVMVVTVSPLAF